MKSLASVWGVAFTQLPIFHLRGHSSRCLVNRSRSCWAKDVLSFLYTHATVRANFRLTASVYNSNFIMCYRIGPAKCARECGVRAYHGMCDARLRLIRAPDRRMKPQAHSHTGDIAYRHNLVHGTAAKHISRRDIISQLR